MLYKISSWAEVLLPEEGDREGEGEGDGLSRFEVGVDIVGRVYWV